MLWRRVAVEGRLENEVEVLKEHLSTLVIDSAVIFQSHSCLQQYQNFLDAEVLMMDETEQRIERDAFVTCFDIYCDKKMAK